MPLHGLGKRDQPIQGRARRADSAPMTFRALPVLLACASLATLAACSSLPAPWREAPPPPVLASVAARPLASPLKVWALTEDQHLLQFLADAPQQILTRQPLKGLAEGERLVGIDYRVARGVLYGLSQRGRLYTLQPEQGLATPVGAAPIGWPLLGRHVGIDFNPVADRLRVVTEAGQNLRVHPDTGLLVDFDPKTDGLQSDVVLGYVAHDVNAGKTPRIVAAGYTYNKDNDKLTTNYALDLDLGLLVMQGSHETKVPPVSPNTGRLMTVGPLGVAGLTAADLDIADLGNVPLAALRTDLTRLYRIDLSTGAATLIGPIGNGAPVRAIAIEP